MTCHSAHTRQHIPCGSPAARPVHRHSHPRSGFVDNFFLVDLAAAACGAIVGCLGAILLGYHAGIGYVVAFGLLWVPAEVLRPFASDFAQDQQGQVCIRPNRAARVLNALEVARGHVMVTGFLSALLFPIGVLLGLRGRLLAVLVLATSILLYGIGEGVSRLVMTCGKRRPK